MGTGLMGASSSAMGGMVAWMNGNQCGDISEVVVTPDKSWVVPVAETTNTILDNIGSSLKNHGGNSTWEATAISIGMVQANMDSMGTNM